MRKAMCGEKLGKAVCETLGIDVKNNLIADVMLVAKPGSKAMAIIEVILTKENMQSIAAKLEDETL